MFTPDRKINPDSFYRKENELEPALKCFCCGDDILKNCVHYITGKHYCNYCKVNILKIN